jgi:hypothetical protein
VKRAAAALVLVSAIVACGKEEWNRSQLGVANPYSETEETEPADDDPIDATVEAAASVDATVDAVIDARPADARTDARDATGQ